MYDLLCLWWPVVPSVVFVASVIAKITPNKTDDKYVGYLLKFVDKFALTTGKTEVPKQIEWK